MRDIIIYYECVLESTFNMHYNVPGILLYLNLQSVIVQC